MKSLVVDASVALKWFVPEPDSDKAVLVIREDVELLAPSIIWLELANAVWKNVRLGNVEADIWNDIQVKLPELALLHTSEGALLQSALTLALAEEHPVFDCVYLALAIQAGAQVVTVDKRFLAAFGKSSHSDFVISLEEAAREL